MSSHAGGYRPVLEEDDVDSTGGEEGSYFAPKRHLIDRIRLWWQEKIVDAGRVKHVISGFIAILIVTFVWQALLSGGSSEPIQPPPATQDPVAKNWTDVRLPSWIIPTHYDIDISRLDLEQLEFGGDVNISLKITQPTSFIVVHNVDLEIQYPQLYAGSEVVSPSHVDSRAQREYTLFWFDGVLRTGEYTLGLRYNGKLTDSLRGFYYSRYKTENGSQRTIATTQFEPTDARRAFPCLDEPAMKATFSISITAPSGYHALSNMPSTSVTSLPSDTHKYRFEKTKKMSTYLITFVVSDFQAVHSKTKRGIAVAVYTQPGNTHLGKYAARVGADVLEFYEERYGVDYPLPKLDMIAIPDFAMGAMEGWGLVTYRDTALLYDPKTSSVTNKQRAAEVIAHELAHQWFGNLVTMDWWNDLWLNEGFAQRMEYLGTEAAEPHWRMDDQFVPADLVRALRADASQYTHPIAIPVHDPQEIEEIFDDISYGKGSSVLRMLQAWLGSDQFFKRIEGYLKSRAYGNAKTEDLWSALGGENADVAGVMSTWTDQPGFPLVTVTKESMSRIAVSQRRFFSAGLSITPNTTYGSESQLWKIPVSVAVYNPDGSVERPETTIVDRENSTIETNAKSEKSLIVINPGRTGMYRIRYPAETYFAFQNALEANLSALTPIDRAGLIEDAFSLLFSGLESDVEIALNFTRSLRNETDPMVWETVLPSLSMLEKYVSFSSISGKVKKYHLSVIESVVNWIGWDEDQNEDDAHVRSLLRGSVLSKALTLGHQPTISKARSYFSRLKKGEDLHLTGDLMAIVLDAGVIYGDEDDYEFVFQQFLKSTFAQDQQRYLHALANTREVYLLQRTLDLAISGLVRKQDLYRLITQVSMYTPTGSLLVYPFLLEHFATLYGWGNYNTLNSLVKNVVAGLTQDAFIDDAEHRFVERKSEMQVPPRIELVVRKGIEIARQRTRWISKFEEPVGKWVHRELQRVGK